MIVKNILLSSVMIALFALAGFSQEHATWKYSAKKVGNTEVELTFTVQIANNFHLYAMDIPEDGPMPLEFTFQASSPDYQLVGKMTPKTEAKEEYDEMFEAKLKYYSHTATFVQKIKVKATKAFTIKGELSYQVCDNSSCIPGDEKFSFSIKDDMLAGAVPKKAPVK